MTIEYIPAGEFKTHCLQLIGEVNSSSRTIIVTRHGKPMAKLGPVNDRKKKKRLLGCMKGTIRIVGDIVSPLPEEWTTPEPWPFSE